MPEVLNMRNLDEIPDGAKRVDRKTKWGNPYKVDEHGTREEVIEKYRDHVTEKIENGELDISELEGYDLVCWCAPKPCHADVLLELANA